MVKVFILLLCLCLCLTVQRGKEAEAKAQLQQRRSGRGGVGRHRGDSEWHTPPVCFYSLFLHVVMKCAEPVMSVLQLRTAMVKGEKGTMSLDVRTTVDKGVSECVSRQQAELSEILDHRLDFLLFAPLGFCCLVLFYLQFFLFSFASPSFIQPSVFCTFVSTRCFSLCLRSLSQRRVMFLKNDYYYTVLDETPFRLVQLLLSYNTVAETESLKGFSLLQIMQ